MDDKNWKELYNAFPVNKDSIWLNNCGTTPASKPVLDEVIRFLKGYSLKSVYTDVKNYEVTSRNIKKILSKLLNCNPEELALIHNTSEGMNFISYGLDLKKGDEILLLENEYPSNVYPWEHWQDKGIKISYVDPGQKPEDFLMNFHKALNSKVKLCAFSTVHWCTGMPLPMKKINGECKKRKVMLVLDGAQGAGHVPVDLSRLDVTAMAFPAWKWLTGPLGLGVLYVNSKKITQIKYIFKGQNSVEDADNYLPYKNVLKKGAARYEYSTPSFTDWVYFETALEILQRTGFDNIIARIYELADYLKDSLEKEGFRVVSSKFPDVKTGIIVFDKPGISSEKMVKTLEKNSIYGALRLNRVRLSVHAYNSKKQIDKVMVVLRKF
jgi:selenocysteine lyase/cysteine desulfurase